MSLFPEVDKEIEEIIKKRNNDFKKFQENLLKSFSPYVCISMDEAFEIENSMCVHCSKYKMKDEVPNCKIIIEFIEEASTSRILDVGKKALCLDDSRLKEKGL
ncbi:hypothetical protein MNB_SV-13-1469 [hydrothermal vent metagenome]|uniref:Uncharacterized protein n=1 Tax=hydrothermal vent metagenome TaxID=652676 RepID=A0A1W1D0R2_9ZZZZ